LEEKARALEAERWKRPEEGLRDRGRERKRQRRRGSNH